MKKERKDEWVQIRIKEYESLTKQRLETIATACLQGVIASGLYMEMSFNRVADTAIAHAEALIIELDKE